MSGLTEANPMKPIRTLLLVPVLVAAALTAGCYKPHAVPHSTLHISADGRYTLNGKPVEPQSLEADIRKIEVPKGELVVQFDVDPSDRVDAVRFAVAATTAANARVAYPSVRAEP